MVDHEQITVADGVGTIFCLALAVAVVWVTGDTAITHPGRTESFTWCYIEGVQMLEEVLARVEVAGAE